MDDGAEPRVARRRGRLTKAWAASSRTKRRPRPRARDGESLDAGLLNVVAACLPPR